MTEGAAVKRVVPAGQAGTTLMELLVVCLVGSIVTCAMITTWFSLNRSSAMTTSHAQTRDFARDGVARLVREVRDAEALPSQAAVVEAQPTSIAFTTTFNQAGNEVDSISPRLVRYEVREGVLYRDMYAPGITDLASTTALRSDVVIPHLIESGPIFSYTYIDENGTQRPQIGEDATHEIAGGDNLSRLLLVKIRVLVDLNPGKAPNGMYITTEAQLRNQRIIE
jgi:Tfp pilus assembly protein PilW